MIAIDIDNVINSLVRRVRVAFKPVCRKTGGGVGVRCLLYQC
jgi:hypothetical protein